MKRLIFKSTMLVTSGLLSLSAQALPMSEFNLIVAEDLKIHSSTTGGKVFVGGNVTALNNHMIGDSLDRATSPSFDSLTTVGDIEGNNTQLHIKNGNVVVGGDVKGVDFDFQGSGGSRIQGDKAALQGQRDRIISELEAASTSFSSMQATGNVSIETNKTLFSYTGTGSTAVFNVNAVDVFAQNSALMLNAGTAETVVINVSTAHSLGGDKFAYDFTTPGGINFTEGFAALSDANNLGASNILWNFYDATELSLGVFRGSLLAIGANITSLGTADGSIAARSLFQNAQIHNHTFNPPSEVPLPASVQFLLMGLFTLAGFRRWRKTKAATRG